MGIFKSSYIFRMARYYFPLLSVNLLRVKLSLKLHMNIATTFSCFSIITHRGSLSFLNFVVKTLFFVNFFCCYLLLHILFTSWKIGLFSISTLRVSFGCIILSLTISVKNSKILKSMINVFFLIHFYNIYVYTYRPYYRPFMHLAIVRCPLLQNFFLMQNT